MNTEICSICLALHYDFHAAKSKEIVIIWLKLGEGASPYRRWNPLVPAIYLVLSNF